MVAGFVAEIGVGNAAVRADDEDAALLVGHTATLGLSEAPTCSACAVEQDARIEVPRRVTSKLIGIALINISDLPTLTSIPKPDCLNLNLTLFLMDLSGKSLSNLV